MKTKKRNQRKSNPAPTGRFEREDWTQFRSLQTISQVSGVPTRLLKRLVAKELADNGLDAGGTCRVGDLPGGFFIEDDGLGIDGGADEIARLFSFRRPMISSKVIRLPTRGALGNGLRVVAGVAFASGGSLRVITCGEAIELRPQENGETFFDVEPAGETRGTRIEVRLGDSVPADPDWCEWADTAISAKGDKPIYAGKTSPWWYDSESFFELLQSAGDDTVLDVMQKFDGCSRIGGLEEFRGRTATSLSFAEAEALLGEIRSRCEPVKAKRLARLKYLPGAYAHTLGRLKLPSGRGSVAAELPFTVEAWCNPSIDKNNRVSILVNRTPVTGDVQISRENPKTVVAIFGCNLAYDFRVGRKPVEIVINVQIPYMPITSTGKEPNLELILDEIRDVVERAARKCQRGNATAQGKPQKAIILDNLAEAIQHASGGNVFRFSLRQLFYAIRPRLIEAFGSEPKYEWFTKVISTHESENGDIARLYRDDRGVLYHPHLREEIPLSTRTVETYDRPKWTFNKILYCEKEGFFPMLRDAKWPERHDCALLTSKGQATKAAKDLLDLLGETDEEILFFVVHDADAYGTSIFQALQEATRSRPGRKVRLINLGLEPEEGIKMGLPVELVEKKGRRKPVADYVSDKWKHWLQSNRIELNAMTTPQFIAWLDGKMAEFGNGKLIPPSAVMSDHFEVRLRIHVEKQVSERILREARFEEQVAAAIAGKASELRKRANGLSVLVVSSLQSEPSDSWRGPIDRVAAEIAGKE